MKTDGARYDPNLLLAASLRRMQPRGRSRGESGESPLRILVAIVVGALVVLLGSLAQAGEGACSSGVESSPRLSPAEASESAGARPRQAASRR